MGWVYKNVVGSFFSDLVNGLLDVFGEIITSMFEKVADINLTNSMVVNANRFTTVFAIALVTFMAAKSYFATYVLETEGDPESSALDILTRAAQATAIISCNAWIGNTFLAFSKAFTLDMVSSADIDITVTLKDMMATAAVGTSLSSGIFIILILVIVIALILFACQAAIRGAELSLMKIVLPIFAVDLVSVSRERWNAFFTSYAITFVGYSLQLLCFRCFAGSLAAMSVDVFDVEGVVAMGWLVLMLRAPKWLEKYCYTSGIGRGIGSGGRTAGQMAMMMMRK